MLYGIDLAKRAIAQQRKAVIVEGYTDVMACHLAGVETAVATCGTAFGGDHIKILRRLLMDNDTFGGQVVFTFDGDAAGQKAAMRAFEDDQRFVAQTFVAVEPNGLDPCELRQKHGRRRGRRTWSTSRFRCSSSRSAACCPGTTSTSRPDASQRCALPLRWWRRSATSRCAPSTRVRSPDGSAWRSSPCRTP